MPTKAKAYPDRRKFALRTDASVESGQREIEKVFKRPTGCVRLVRPNGRAARADKGIGAFLKDWNA